MVVDDQIQQYDIIVGRSFTDHDHVIFFKTTDQLLFAYGMSLPYQDTGVLSETGNKPIVRIARETQNIPAKSIKMVEVEVDHQQIEVMLINVGDVEARLARGDYVVVVLDCQRTTGDN